MIESAKNCLSQMIAPAAVQENSSLWKTSIDLWSQDSRAHLLSLKIVNFRAQKMFWMIFFWLTSKISRQLFKYNCHLKIQSIDFSNSRLFFSS